MKTIYVLMIALLLAAGAQAQVSRVSLQASGLTCSMCSKAVKNALEKVSFVDKVQVDIKNQQYNLSFKEGSTVDFDALSGAVEGPASR
jgi:copper chaperone CopZ